MEDLKQLEVLTSSLQARVKRLNKFLVALEKKVLIVPEDRIIPFGSFEHKDYMTLYVKNLALFESCVETLRRVHTASEQAKDESARESDELYAMIKSLSVEEKGALREFYFKARGIDEEKALHQ